MDARAAREDARIGVSGGLVAGIGVSCAAHQVCSQARLERRGSDDASSPKTVEADAGLRFARPGPDLGGQAPLRRAGRTLQHRAAKGKTIRRPGCGKGLVNRLSTRAASIWRFNPVFEVLRLGVAKC
jgi:positive regulator of sigma E activity